MNSTHSDKHKYLPATLTELLGLSAGKFPDRPFIGQKDTEDFYQWSTYKQIYERSQHFGSGLKQLGVEQGDHVGIVLKNSIEWCVSAFGCYKIGAILTPINEREVPKTWEKIIYSTDIKVLITTKELHKQLFEIINQAPFPIKTVIIDSTGNNSFAHVEQLGIENPVNAISVDPSHTANLIFTSGSCGHPKGVYSSHKNILSVVFALKEHFPNLNETSKAFSIFPWSHIAGLVDELFFGIYLGASIAVMDTRKTLIDDFQRIQPTVVATAPILFYRIYDKIQEKLNSQGEWINSLFELALIESRKKRKTGKESFLYKILNNLILQNVRAAFGGELKMSVVGGAAMNEKITQFFIDLGVEIYNGYGLTETTGMLTFNSPRFENKIASVGKPLKNMDVRIDTSKTPEGCDYGEIIAYGPNIMMGYHENHELTETLKTEDGGFRTGDLGKIDCDGYLSIVGRVKEEYKLSNGKYIHPSLMEEEIKSNFYITNAMIYGVNQPYNICIIVPNFENLKGLAKRLHVYSSNREDIIKDAMVQEFLQTEIDNQLLHKFTSYEIPKKFLYVIEDFTIENGLLTNTLKLKRDSIIAKYQYDILDLFPEE